MDENIRTLKNALIGVIKRELCASTARHPSLILFSRPPPFLSSASSSTGVSYHEGESFQDNVSPRPPIPHSLGGLPRRGTLKKNARTGRKREQEGLRKWRPMLEICSCASRACCQRQTIIHIHRFPFSTVLPVKASPDDDEDDDHLFP